MTPTDFAPAPDPRTAPDDQRGMRLDPARRLRPDPGLDALWRVAAAIGAALIVLLLLVGLAGWSLAPRLDARTYSDVPATAHLGSPTALQIDSEVNDVRVIRSDDATEVTVSLVETGASTVPPEGTVVRAELAVETDGTSKSVTVREPLRDSALPWERQNHDLLVVVPAALAPALTLTADVGDIDLTGDFSSITVEAGLGEVTLEEVTAPDGLGIRADVGGIDVSLAGPVPGGIDLSTSVGDVTLRLAPDAEGDADITAETGDVTVQVPGSARRQVEATAEVGETRIDSRITGASGDIVGTLRVSAAVGDVNVTR